MFKKLFDRKGSPTNDGKVPASTKVDQVYWVKKFTLELSNMEGNPSYALTHQLTVGSEIGNIVIADPSVSPRHCTFILQEDVISVIDHGSLAGTFINGKKISPGRYIILEETDVVMAGDLEIKIQSQNEAVRDDVPEFIPEDLVEEEVPVEVEEEVVDEAEEIEEVEEVEEAEEIVEAEPEKKLQLSSHPKFATNSIVRLIAVISDVLIAYALYVVFYPFDEFRSFVNDVPVATGELLDINWTGLEAILQEEYAFVGEMFKDLYSFFSATFHVGPFFLLFIIVRLTSTLVLGVSVSEGILGVRSYGNPVWKRVGGFLRVCIGVFTGPFLVFDVPAVISKRTFKEFMTFTHTYLSSKFVAILGVLLYLPLLLVMVLLSPLFQGLEFPDPILVNEVLDRRIKVVQSGDEISKEKVKDYSSFLKMEVEYDSESVSFIPMFKFSGHNQKISYKPSLVIHHQELQRPVQLEILKTLNFKELLGIGIKGNFFLYEKFPEIYNFVYASEAANPSFKAKNTEESNRKFADEVVTFTKIALELNATNAFDQMQTYTPLIKSLMDYRSSLLALIEYKEFDQIGFVKLGNAYFLRISYLRQKPFDLLIPLIKGEGRMLKIEFDKKENLGALSNKFYKFTLADSDWFSTIDGGLQEDILTPLQVLDFFSNLNLKDPKMSPEKAQALYGYYFEKSSEVFRREDEGEYHLWKKSVESIFTIMEKLKDAVPEVDSDIADPRMKLFQNFQDLKDAVESKNKEYFGIETSVTL